MLHLEIFDGTTKLELTRWNAALVFFSKAKQPVSWRRPPEAVPFSATWTDGPKRSPPRCQPPSVGSAGMPACIPCFKTLDQKDGSGSGKPDPAASSKKMILACFYATDGTVSAPYRLSRKANSAPPSRHRRMLRPIRPPVPTGPSRASRENCWPGRTATAFVLLPTIVRRPT